MLNLEVLHTIGKLVKDLRDFTCAEEIEEMLFLLQYDYINKEGSPLYPVKTYIGENGIHVVFISDLLKVSEPLDVYSYSALFKYYYIIEEYYKKYSRCSSEEIKMMVKEIIDTKDLNEKYFVYDNYDYRYIKKARHEVRASKHIYVYYLKAALVLLYILPLPSVGIIHYYATIRPMSEEKYLFVYRFLVIGVICFIIWLIWTIKWRRPTDYEIEHADQSSNSNRVM